MLDFSAFSHRDLQIFHAVLTMAEADGVMDIRFLRSELHNNIFRRRKRRPRQRTSMQPCPSCKHGVLVGPYNMDGLKIFRCSRKCGYSMAV